MVEYTEVNVKLNKLKKAVKYNDGATLRISIKFFNKDELPHELLLTTRQSTKLRNAINNNMATDLKLSPAQIKKLIQSGEIYQSGILLKGVTKTIENETKEQRGGFLSMLLVTLGASLL